MVELKYGLFDVSAADDATSSCTNKQPFADVSALNTPDLDLLIVKPFATLEPNQWILDGSKQEFPNKPKEENFGLWSLSQSDDDCAFGTPITVTCEFTEPHTAAGITFIFREDSYEYANKLKTQFYNASGGLLLEKIFYPDRPNFFADALVEDYRKIVITFYGTSLPNRYLKLTEIKYGVQKTFSDDSVISAQILEEVDPISAELSINTLEFTAHTTDFALLDPSGIYGLLQQRQVIEASIDGTAFGTFFLDEPESEDNDTTTFKCIDFIGVIDATEFMGGMYADKNVGALISEIMDSAGVEVSEYQIAAAVASKTVSGYIPICTHREALRQVAFATGAIVDCSRGKMIKIYPQDESVMGTITHDEKMTGHTVKFKTLVTGVEVTAHRYAAGASKTNIYEATLTAGQYTIAFSSPYSSISASGAAILESGANHAVINVTAAGEVTISGYPYEDSTAVVGVYTQELPANAKPNIISCDASATLVSSSNAAEIAQRLYDFYQERYEGEGDILLGGEKVGEVWRMNSLNDRDLQGVIQSLDIDMLTEVAQLKLTGSAKAREENA